MASETYEFLQNIAKGGEYDRWSYPEHNIISRIVPHKNPQSTEVILTFDNEEDFLKILGIENEDDYYVWKRFMGNYYYGYDIDDYHARDSWDEGYLLGDFNEENKQLLSEILRYINPTLRLDEENYSKISKYLLSHREYVRYVDEIVYDYAVKEDECKERAVVDVLTKETSRPLDKVGIFEVHHGRTFRTTVGVLLHWYRALKAQDEDLKELLQMLYKKYNNTNPGDWYELEYNVYCDDFDREGWQQTVNDNLSSLLDKIQEDYDGYQDLDEYKKLSEYVYKLGGFDRWINIPEKKVEVRFTDIDIKTNRLVFIMKKPGGDSQKRSVTNLEDLYTQLYHPELFEQVRKILRKLL